MIRSVILILLVLIWPMGLGQERAAAIFESGQNAHEAGNLERAIELYGEALKLDPSYWQAEFQRGAAYLSLNRTSEAKASMKRVRELLAGYKPSPDLKRILSRVEINLGEIALAESSVGEAEKHFREAIRQDAGAARAHSGLAEILLASGKRAEAISEARSAIAAGDAGGQIHAILGVALTQDGAYDEALASLSRALERDPKNVIALLYRAEVLIARDKLNEAIGDLRAAIEIEPLPKTKLRLASAYAQVKRYDEAIAIYREILAGDPGNGDAQTGLAVALIESGKGGDAIAQLESIIKSNPDRADVRAQLAELYLPGQPEKALEEYTAASRIDPEKISYRIGVAAALVKLRRFDKAVELLTGILGQNPAPDVAYFAHTNLATALFEMDDFPNAAREFIWILDHQKEHGDRKRTAITLYFLGICFDKLGDYEQAKKAYDQFLAIAGTENQLEIDKIKLRLPSLERQIREGKGKRRERGTR